MGNDPLFWQIILQVVLISLNAVFACAEIAVITMNDAKLAKLASEGDKRAVKLARLTSQPARFSSRDHSGRHHAQRLLRQRVCGGQLCKAYHSRAHGGRNRDSRRDDQHDFGVDHYTDSDIFYARIW